MKFIITLMLKLKHVICTWIYILFRSIKTYNTDKKCMKSGNQANLLYKASISHSHKPCTEMESGIRLSDTLIWNVCLGSWS